MCPALRIDSNKDKLDLQTVLKAEHEDVLLSVALAKMQRCRREKKKKKEEKKKEKERRERNSSKKKKKRNLQGGGKRYI